MKKQILISLISLGSIFTVNAQIYTPTGIIQGASGNNYVGIGTNTPYAPLHIVKSNTDTDEILLKLSHRGSVNVGNAILIGNESYDMGSKIIGYNNPSNTNDTRLEFQTSSSAGNYVSVMNLLSNGNVGIGTNTPFAPLHIVKSNTNTDEILLKLSHRGSVNVGNAILIGNESYDMGSKIIGYNNPSNTNDTRLEFQTSSSVGNYVSVMNLLSNGNVGIGTSSPTYKLDVCGTIRAKEVIVDLNGTCAPDFVFKSDYKLMNLKELEEFVNTNQHLPEIASEKEMVENGVNMKDLQMKLLQKMEEMTLYMIEQNKKIEALQSEIKEIKKK